MTDGTLLFIQYGDYRFDLRNLAGGGEETYQAQRGAVEFIRDTAAPGRPTVVVNMVTPQARDDIVADGVRVIGLGPDGPATGWRAWWRLLDRLRPARIVLRTPLLPVLAWAAKTRCPTIAILADSFQASSVRGRLKRWAMRRALSGRSVRYVGNHGRNASFQLAAMGVPRAKIVPWDWAPSRSPHEYAAKPGIGDPAAPTLLFVGALSEAKGADDLVRAVALLAGQGRLARLRMLGSGDTRRIAALAASLGVDAQVELAGAVPNKAVVPAMRAADIVVIASRHDYPEGLPLTIYEALIARTPIVASDHPMFLGNLVNGESAAIVPAASPAGLASGIARLADDPALYAALSTNSAGAWERLQIPVTFEKMVAHWLAGDRAWLDRHSLAGWDYGARP